MINADEVKNMVINLGAEDCGIANIERFAGAPHGFHPTDIYRDCKSVVVYLKSFPHGAVIADNLIPYTHSSNVTFMELDHVGLELCRKLQTKGIQAVMVPCDTPYEYWDAEKMRGMGILSMRHAGYLAGLGILGKNTLLINRRFGNMIYIGAVLANIDLEPDPLATDPVCPPNCRICIDACPVRALDGVTVDQSKCRKYSTAKTGRDYNVYVCNNCRKNCPHFQRGL